MGREWGSEKVVSKKKRCLRWTLEDRSDFHREREQRWVQWQKGGETCKTLCFGNKDLGVSMPHCSHRRNGNGHSGLQEAGFAGSLCPALTVSLRPSTKGLLWQCSELLQVVSGIDALSSRASSLP